MKIIRFLLLCLVAIGLPLAAPPPSASAQAIRADSAGNLREDSVLNLAGPRITGVLPPTHLGTGTPSSATVLRGDGAWVGTTATGNTIASTTGILAGDGAGNAVGVTLWNPQPTRDYDFRMLLSRSASERFVRYAAARSITLAADSVNGSEDNAGSLYSPKLTLPQAIGDGATVGLYRGSTFRESLPLFTLGNTYGIAIQDVGLRSSTVLPVISALDPVTTFTNNGDGTYSCLWTPADSSIDNNGYNNVYVVEIDKAAEAATPIAARHRMWDVSGLTAVATTAGSVWVQPPGTGAGQSGSTIQWKATLRPAAVNFGSAGPPIGGYPDPSNGLYRYEVVSRYCPANLGGPANTGDAAVSGVQLVGSSYGYGELAAPLHFVGDRLAMIHSTTHNAVIGGGSLQRSVFYEMGDAQSIQLAAYAPNGTGQSFDLRSSFFFADNNPARTAYGFLAHADNNLTGKFERVDITDCAFLGANADDGSFAGQGVGIGFDAVKQGTVERVYVSRFFRPLHTSNGSAMECRDSVFRDFALFFLPTSFHDNIAAYYTGTNTTALGASSGVDMGDLSYPTNNINNLYWFGTRTATFGSPSPGSVHTHNIYIGGYAGGPNSPGIGLFYPLFNSASLGTFQLDYNLIIHLSGEFRAYYGYGVNGNYAPSWAAYRVQFPSLDAHSLYLDLRNDARGIDAVFADARNGDFRWAQTEVGRQCAAFCAANNVGPATVTTHWPVVPTVDDAVHQLTDM